MIEVRMVNEDPKETKIMNHLRSLRWSMEQGRYGRAPVSGPRGQYLFKLTDVEIKDYAMQQADRDPESAKILPFPTSDYEQH